MSLCLYQIEFVLTVPCQQNIHGQRDFWYVWTWLDDVDSLACAIHHQAGYSPSSVESSVAASCWSRLGANEWLCRTVCQAGRATG